MKHLLVVRLDMESEFSARRRKRSVLWNIVLNKIKQENETFPFTRDEITKKFSNMLITYNRIKRRNNKTGRAATLWDYYEKFDVVYGSRHCTNPPQGNLASSFLDERIRDAEEQGEQHRSTEEAENVVPNESTYDSSPCAKRRRRTKRGMAFS